MWSLPLTLSLPNVAKRKFRPKFQISFSNILRNKWHHVKVQAESFHLNGHIIGFRPRTQKLESPYKTPSNTLAVKGLNYLCGYIKPQGLMFLNRDSMVLDWDSWFFTRWVPWLTITICNKITEIVYGKICFFFHNRP